MKTIIGALVLVILAANIITDIHLNRKIDALDEEIFRYMKEEHNARVESNE